jgi:hypothetical protein
LHAFHGFVGGLFPLVPEAEDLHGMLPVIQLGQLLREIFHMNSRSAVDVGRILVGEEGDFHEW